AGPLVRNKKLDSYGGSARGARNRRDDSGDSDEREHDAEKAALHDVSFDRMQVLTRRRGSERSSRTPVFFAGSPRPLIRPSHTGLRETTGRRWLPAGDGRASAVLRASSATVSSNGRGPSGSQDLAFPATLRPEAAATGPRTLAPHRLAAPVPAN